jgi:hypothetical protein
MEKNMKTMYEFTINQEKEVEKVDVSTNEKGEEVKVTSKAKVNVPIKLSIKKPSRGLFDEAELFFGVRLSEGIKAGLLTRALLAKRFSNDGGVFSDSDKEEYTKLYIKLFELQTEFQKVSLKEEKNRSETEKNEYKRIIKEIAETREKLQDYEFAQASLFEQTAENRARNKTIMWWVLQLSQLQDDEGKFQDLFKGSSYEEKLEAYDLVEEKSEDSWERRALSKFVYLISFWYTGRASSQEEFEKLVKLIDSDEYKNDKAKATT